LWSDRSAGLEEAAPHALFTLIVHRDRRRSIDQELVAADGSRFGILDQQVVPAWAFVARPTPPPVSSETSTRRPLI